MFHFRFFLAYFQLHRSCSSRDEYFHCALIRTRQNGILESFNHECYLIARLKSSALYRSFIPTSHHCFIQGGNKNQRTLHPLQSRVLTSRTFGKAVPRNFSFLSLVLLVFLFVDHTGELRFSFLNLLPVTLYGLILYFLILPPPPLFFFFVVSALRLTSKHCVL